jgi:beta-galactosidase
MITNRTLLPTPPFIYSGEIHYFRIPRGKWAAHLDRAVEAGLNMVSTYIPWRWHEPEEGAPDFSGETRPERDLLSFVELCGERGLYLSARVGPVCNGEMVHEGLPDWLIERYPETMLQLRPGEAIHHVGAPSYLNPTFQAQVHRWYDALLPLLAPRQVTRGGCIALVQLCNEIAMVNWVGRAVDHSPPVRRLYQRFLAETYQSVGELNQAHGTSYSSFEEVEQPPLRYDGGLLKYIDRARFFRDYYAEYFHTLETAARGRGIEVPVSANIPHFYDFDVRGRGIYSPLTTSLFRDFTRKTSGIVFGGAYQPRRIDWDNFHDLFLTSAMVRMIAEPRARLICAEMQTGIMYDRPRLYPSDVELNILSCLASGLDGVNGYMFSGGVNPARLGQFGTSHEWQAPVRPDGTVRRHFATVKRHGAWLSSFGATLATTRAVESVQLGFYAPYWMTEFMSGAFVTELEQKRKEAFYDGLARLLHVLNYPPRVVDLERDDLDAGRPLFLFTTGFMDPVAQERVAAFVRDGGRLFFGPEIPRTDLRGEPCPILAQALSLSRATQHGRSALHYGGERTFFADRATLFTPPRGSRVFIHDGAGRAAAALWRCGEGQVLFCGCALSDRFQFLVPLFDRMASSLRATRPVRVTNDELCAALREGERGSFLFLINYHEYPLESGVSLPSGSLPKLTVPARSGLILPLRLYVNPELTIESCTLSLRDLVETEQEVVLRLGGEAGREGVLRLRGELRELVLEGGQLRVRRGRGKEAHSVRCTLAVAEATLRVRLGAPATSRSRGARHG